MYSLLLSLALLQTCSALVPAPRQVVTSNQALPTPTTYSLETPLAQPTQNLLPRCDSPPCEYGPGEAQTLSAAVVTSTILSTTSVPCYITTYVTDSTTTTETIYSTETVTSTVTEEGTVYIIKYSPTPVVKSTVYESVLQITQTMTAMWVETEGSYSEETKTGDIKTVDGGTGGGYDKGGDESGWKDAGNGDHSAPAPYETGEWKNAGAGSAAPPASSVPAAAPAPAPAPVAQGNAWTHASANAVAPIAATPIVGVNAANGNAGSGWSTASPGVTLAANWHNGTGRSLPIDWWMLGLTAISIVFALLTLL